MRALPLAAATLLGIAVGNACLLELDHDVACGDGFVDREAGEQCDPAAPGNLTDCACNEETCACAECGNGEVEAFAGEECGATAKTSTRASCSRNRLDTAVWTAWRT